MARPTLKRPYTTSNAPSEYATLGSNCTTKNLNTITTIPNTT